MDRGTDAYSEPAASSAQPAALLVASCLGAGGGLLVRYADAWHRLDELASTGFAVNEPRTAVARVLWTSDDPQTRAELIVSDAVGVKRYLRVDELQEPHGLLWDGDLLVAVSTLRNSLLWLDAAGDVVRERRFGGAGDAWHLNCPAWADGRLVVTAFGRHDCHRDWARSGALMGAGVILDVETGEPLIEGLSAPHDPVRLPDGWLVCDSRTSRVLRLDDAGAVLGECALGGWTRGLLLDGDHVHVGISARRDHASPDTAALATLRLDDLAMVDRVSVPCDEVFALAQVDRALVAGLAVGFSTNPARATALAPPANRLAAARTVPADDDSAAIDAHVASGPVLTDRFFDIAFTVDRRGGAALLPIGEGAWRIGARWILPDGSRRDDGPRAGLGAPVLPGSASTGLLRVRAGTDPGRHLLEVGLLQEGVQWHPTATATLAIDVTEPARAEPAEVRHMFSIPERRTA